MKLARNLFLGLTLLVLLYGGVYRFFFREPVRSSRIWGDVNLSGFEKLSHKFFAPAAEFDLRMTFDRPLRNRLRGHWIHPETADFVTLSGNGTFTFQLGEFRCAGKAVVDRWVGTYYAEFQDGGLTRCFEFWSDPHDIATAGTWIRNKRDKPLPVPENYWIDLTRAPAP